VLKLHASVSDQGRERMVNKSGDVVCASHISKVGSHMTGSDRTGFLPRLGVFLVISRPGNCARG
jgi:transposase InsO family protein